MLKSFLTFNSSFCSVYLSKLRENQLFIFARTKDEMSFRDCVRWTCVETETRTAAINCVTVVFYVDKCCKSPE